MAFKTLAFRNDVQVALFVHELQGQLSDGKWENTRNTEPFWRHLDNVICDPKNVGRDFACRRDNFNFADADLVEVIGDRMLNIARTARFLGSKMNDSIWQNMFWLEEGAFSTYWLENRLPKLKVEHPEIDWDKMVTDITIAVNDQTYGYKHLLKDLIDMRKIIKIRRNVEVVENLQGA